MVEKNETFPPAWFMKAHIGFGGKGIFMKVIFGMQHSDFGST